MGPAFGRLEKGDKNQQEVLLVVVVGPSAALFLTPNLLSHLNLPLPSAVFPDSQQALDCPQTPSQHPQPSGPSLLGEALCCAIWETPFRQVPHGPHPPSSCARCLLLGYHTPRIMGWPSLSRLSLSRGCSSSDLTTFPTALPPFISKLSPNPPQFWESLPLQWGCLMEKGTFPKKAFKHSNLKAKTQGQKEIGQVVEKPICVAWGCSWHFLGGDFKLGEPSCCPVGLLTSPLHVSPFVCSALTDEWLQQVT